MANVLFRRGTTAELNNIPITDGAVLFDTTSFKIYVDNNNERLQYGGDTDLISNISDARAQNTFSSVAIVDLFLQKTSCVNSASTALAVTQDNIPLGCKAFAEEIGNNDFTRAGDSVSEAIDNITKHMDATLAQGATSLTFTNANFNSNTTFSIAPSVYGVQPKDAVLSGTTLTLTYKAQNQDVNIRLYYKNIT